MMMYFHGGFNEIILFECWTIDSVGTAEIIGILPVTSIPYLLYLQDCVHTLYIWNGYTLYKEVVVCLHLPSSYVELAVSS